MTQKTRCWWPGEDPLYVSYHDTEWGVPEHDPRALYEKLVLDGFQAGLSWITILRKREKVEQDLALGRQQGCVQTGPRRQPADHIVGDQALQEIARFRP